MMAAAPEIPALPQNVEAEAALLGALMIDNRLIDRVQLKLTPAHFFEPLHGRIYEAILRVAGGNRIANPVSLKPLFEADEAMKEVGGPAYLAQLTGSGAAIIGARDFADQIYDLALLRALIGVGRDLIECAHDTSEEIAPLARIEQAEAELAKVAQLGRDSMDGTRELSAAEAADLAIRAGEDAHERGVLCGMESLDAAMGPIRRRKMAVLAGRPGMGKSALASSYGLGAAGRGHGIILFSLEMDAEALAARMLSDLSFDGHGKPVPYELIEGGQLSMPDMRRVMEARDRLAELPIRIVDIGQCTTGRLNAMVRRWKRRMESQGQSLDLVIVDYLQLLRPNSKTRDRIELVTEVSQDLRRIAKEHAVGVMALSQLSREVERRPDKRPIISDLRESGQIEQDADIILFLYRQEYYLSQVEPPESEEAKAAEERAKWERAMELTRGTIEFICAKKRHGRTGKEIGRFHGAFGAVRG